MLKLYLVTGFLGAGKTTYLRNFLRLFPQERCALIVNEFGSVGVDGELLRERDSLLREVNNGSIFCACRQEQFREALEDVLRQAPDIVLVEASGLSDPSNVRQLLRDFRLESAYAGAVCLVDAVRFPKISTTARSVARQLRAADALLLNKVDMATPDQIKETRTLLTRMRPDLPVLETSYGQISREWLESLTHPDVQPNETGIQTKDISIRKYCVTLRDGFPPQALEHFIRMFLEDTYRVKGFVRLDGRIFLVDCVQDEFRMSAYTPDVELERINRLVLLSGDGMPLRCSLDEARRWYADYVEDICSE